MANAAVAVCLISADYLDSEFCVKEEIPYLLQRRERDGMVLIPVLLRPCLWEAVDWLKPIQMLPRDGKSVAEDFRDDADMPFTEVAGGSSRSSTTRPTGRPRRPRLAGRRRRRWTSGACPSPAPNSSAARASWRCWTRPGQSGETHVVSLVAWGGVGKTTLVNKWLERLAADNYRGARRVFGWSFYSQGTGERVTSADLFIAEALRWFGDPDPTQGSPWDKGQRLADLVRGEKTLLVLDGLEPLQSDLALRARQGQGPGLGSAVGGAGAAEPRPVRDHHPGAGGRPGGVPGDAPGRRTWSRSPPRRAGRCCGSAACKAPTPNWRRPRATSAATPWR